ncbi:MAG: hypothetical protein AAF403_04725 [Pseudomonadota bacterium]
MMIHLKAWLLSCFLIFWVLGQIFFGYPPEALSQSTNRNFCNVDYIDDIDDAYLTKREKIEKLNEAFFDSINKREECETENTQNNTSNQQNTASGGGASGGGSANNASNSLDQAQGDEGGGAFVESLESPDIMGVATSSEGDQIGDENIEDDFATQGSITRQGGDRDAETYIPEDIEPPDNDDVIKKLIYEKALNEKDPNIQKKLWEEYRKY